MNAIRIVISVFLLILFGLAVAGWNWFSSLPPEDAPPAGQMWGARVVLGLCCVASIGALALLWSVKQPQAN